MQTTSSQLLNVALQANYLVLTYFNSSNITTKLLDMVRNDGEWYSLELSLNLTASIFSITTDRLIHSVPLDFFIQPFSLHFDLILGSPSSFQSHIPQIGDLPTLQGFEGCIRNVSLGGQLLSLDYNFSADYSLIQPQSPIPGCPREEVCNGPTPCVNGGVCSTGWEGYSCNCSVDYEGQNCSEGMCVNSLSNLNFPLSLSLTSSLPPLPPPPPPPPL